jgi:hypothetical protein
MARTARDEALCPNAKNHHQPGIPDGYLDRQDWFEKMAKTHVQTFCPSCRLWVIWVPKGAGLARRIARRKATRVE